MPPNLLSPCFATAMLAIIKTRQWADLVIKDSFCNEAWIRINLISWQQAHVKKIVMVSMKMHVVSHCSTYKILSFVYNDHIDDIAELNLMGMGAHTVALENK